MTRIALKNKKTEKIFRGILLWENAYGWMIIEDSPGAGQVWFDNLWYEQI